MPAKVNFTAEENIIIRDIFRFKVENSWSQIECERQFRQRSNRSVSFKTLLLRYNALLSGEEKNVPIQDHQIDNSDQTFPINQQPISSELQTNLEGQSKILSAENKVEITDEIEHDMSILEIEDQPVNLRQKTNGDQNYIEVVNNIDVLTPSRRGRGRPRVTKRGKAPLTIQTEDRKRRNRVKNKSSLEQKTRRQQNIQNQNNLTKQTPEEASERLNSISKQQKEHRLTET